MAERAVNKNAQAMVVCLAPDVCKTPAGSAMVPVPYTITCKFDVATDTATSVKYSGDPAFVMTSRLPHVQNDEAGTGGGLISGVNRGTCRPIVSSSTVKANGQFVVRHNDLMQMNCNGANGPANTVGRIVYIGVGKAPAAGETVSKEERVTTDQDGKTTVEKREVTRDPKTGALTETRQRTTIDPKTGDISTQQVSMTDNLDGTRTVNVSEGSFSPGKNSYTFKETTATVPGFGSSGSTGPVLGAGQIGKVQPDGRTYLGDGMYARPGTPATTAPSPGTPPGSGAPPLSGDDTSAGDTAFDEGEAFDEAEYEQALAEQAAAEAEIAALQRELGWQAAETAADVAGLVDPTPVSDIVGAGLALRRGDFLGAGLNLISCLPYAGDLIAKPIKGTRAARKAAQLAQRLGKLKAKLEKAKDTLNRLAKRRKPKAPGGGVPPKGKPADGGHIPKKPSASDASEGKQPKTKKKSKPIQPRKYEKKTVNKDGSTTYVMKDKNGKTFELTYDKDGYPDFSTYKYNGTDGLSEVNIDYTGDRNADFRAANEAAGFKTKPPGYTWHHHQNGTTMQLIRTDIHGAAPHTGGFAHGHH